MYQKNDEPGNESLDYLFIREEMLKHEIGSLKDSLSDVQEAIRDKVSGNAGLMRKLQSKEDGTVNFEVDGIMVKETIPKRVTWDSVGLAEALAELSSASVNVPYTMKVTISETEWKKLDVATQRVLMKFRTVEHSKSRIERVDNDRNETAQRR